MDCWTLLQLPEEADERTIKRTYARLLKSCRPDDDAEGFQRLREAYEEALAYSRWRADWEEEDTTVQAPVAELAYGDLNDLAELMDVSALHPAPFETPQANPAHTLLSGLNASNVRERWVLSVQQDCTDAFQAGLLRHCFDKPSERVEIASWAVQHLEWLTPWQQVAMTPWQHDTLTSELLQEYRNTLRNLLEQKDERAFINQLTQYSNQPWLRVFDLQQQWQRIVLQLLHDSQWSVPLFERVCQAFGWDDQTGVFPEPAWMWRELVSRCEQESFFANLQDKAQEMRHPPADAQAARLLLTPMSASQQKRMIDGFGENEWNACQHLSEVLTWRYPQLLERLPNPDAFFWRTFVPRPIYTQVLIRLWGVFALGFLLSLIKPQPEVLDARSIILFLLLALVPAGIGFRVTQFWASISSSFRVPDLWLSQHLIPKRLNPNQYWLIIRHGVPQAIMLVACGLMAGVLGMVTYAGALLINLLHTKRIGQISHKFSQGYPWLNGLHWAFWSPLQAAFLVVMVAVIIAAQHYLPAVPWTHFDPPKP
ncbi:MULTISPECIES: J domain-containing protein [Pseudomonas]|uniref:J domain-containing protein n=1 Tax=Pseudomonas TaxID=286 RepID=UPI000CFB3CCF|nr:MULTISPECIES: J domain-containing protein [Pseudomonas]PQZ84041.1 molecular chaperone DnaJ [Pseudomonas trivialis]PRB20077.1 molecular chaperone DnaJ [Pseudomonas sp. MYb60]